MNTLAPKGQKGFGHIISREPRYLFWAQNKNPENSAAATDVKTPGNLHTYLHTTTVF